MKKLNYLLRIIVMILAVLMLLAGCTSKKLGYYNPTIFFGEADLNEKDVFAEISSDTNVEQKKMVLQVFQELCEMYQISKATPKVKTLNKSQLNQIVDSNSVNVSGVYGGEETIYVRGNFSHEDISVICHELCHYLSGCGVKYIIEEGYITGNSLNEGFTNYFSTKLYPHHKNCSVYEFETFVASQFVEIIGEEMAKEVYFYGDVQKLKEDFNTALKDIYPNEKSNVKRLTSTPFDTLCATLEMYNLCIFDIESKEEALTWAMMSAECVEEMILNYAEQKGKKEECQELLKEFLDAEQAIEWTIFSNLDEMID